MIFDKLTELKNSRGLTNQQISDLSGVPLSTVTRIFNGQTDNPNIQTVADIVSAMGGSVDEVLGLKPPEKGEKEDNLIELYREIIKSKNRDIKRLFWILAIVICIITVALALDLLVGNIGFIRY